MGCWVYLYPEHTYYIITGFKIVSSYRGPKKKALKKMTIETWKLFKKEKILVNHSGKKGLIIKSEGLYNCNEILIKIWIKDLK